MTDSEFPNRPVHDDFNLLSAVVIAFDTEVEEASPGDDKIIPTIVSRYIDPDSLTYMAMHRAVHAFKMTSGAEVTNRVDELIALTGLYLDAFMAGCAYQQSKDGVVVQDD